MQTVPRREENRLARQRLAEDLGQIECFGKLERALEVRSGEIELSVEDEEASELRRDRGDVLVGILPLELRECRFEPFDRPWRMTFSKVDLGEDCRDACSLLLEPLALEDRVSLVQERTGAIRTGSQPRPCAPPALRAQLSGFDHRASSAA